MTGEPTPTAYLLDHPPARSQMRRPRRAAATGAIVLHTAENVPDVTGADGSAEAVAQFIQRRGTAGSYHDVADSDSIVHLVPYDAEAFGEGTGGNRWALHLSFACRTTDWATLPTDRVHAILANGAVAAARMARWVRTVHGVTVPAVLLDAAAYRAGQPGFITHARLDPVRRTDPGRDFPWFTFARLFDDTVAREAHMTDTPAARIRRMLNANGAQPPLPVVDTVDDRTADALDAVLRWLNAQVDARTVHAGAETARADRAEAEARAEAQHADELRRRLDGARRTVELADSITALLSELSDDVERADGRLQAILDEAFGRSTTLLVPDEPTTGAP